MFRGGIATDFTVKVNTKFAHGGTEAHVHPYFMVTEEGTGNVFVYPLNVGSREAADIIMNTRHCSRILFNKDSMELRKQGMCLAHNTIRSAYSQWMAEHR